MSGSTDNNYPPESNYLNGCNTIILLCNMISNFFVFFEKNFINWEMFYVDDVYEM